MRIFPRKRILSEGGGDINIDLTEPQVKALVARTFENMAVYVKLRKRFKGRL